METDAGMAKPGDATAEFGALVEPHRRELHVHCYRILGSLHDAEDAVQETLLRAWRRFDTFEGRAPLRAWLYKIATNTCLDMLDRRPRRLPAAPAADPSLPPEPPRAGAVWIEPYPDDLLADPTADPEARYIAREHTALAFVAALQTLTPRQRAVLILREVLGFRAAETAAMLDLTLPATTSLLHRARTALRRHHPDPGAAPAGERGELLARYLRAWEAADVEGLVALLKDEARVAMPPSPSWYQGRGAIAAVAAAYVFGDAGAGRWRLVPTRANGQPAFALYQRAPGGYAAAGVQVLTFDGDLIADITTFLEPALVRWFGLPASLGG